MAKCTDVRWLQLSCSVLAVRPAVLHFKMTRDALVSTARLLTPQTVKVKGKVLFSDVFCGAYFTFAVSKEGGIYGFGLSNYHQLDHCKP
ncbi:hypothetical protein CRUP_021705 [Coryphaenoides rupestris]|nr:hypothetical protein CRUP_021705 [Coryphaenoides rupestris]